MFWDWRNHTITSAGAANAYQPVLLDGTGTLDTTLLPASLVFSGITITEYADGITQLKNPGFALANNAAYQFATALAGFVFVRSSGGEWWMGTFNGSSNSVTEIAKSAGVSTTKDNAATLNIYYDAVDAKYEIQNKLGGDKTIAVFVLSRG